MRAAVGPLVDLDYPLKDGTTRRQHLQQIGKWDLIEELSPVVPPEAAYLWDWFWEIVNGKGSEEGFWTCLRSWSEMAGTRPSIWEAGVLHRLHNEYQMQVRKKVMGG